MRKQIQGLPETSYVLDSRTPNANSPTLALMWIKCLSLPKT
jgi:hypothetical protein